MKSGGRNPFPWLLGILAVLWIGLFFLKHPGVIRNVRAYYGRPAQSTQPLAPPSGLPATLGQKLAKIPLPEMPSFPRPATPQITIIIDDFGYRLTDFETLRNLGLPVTVSVIPNLTYSRTTAEMARASGYEVMLHLPIAPENGTPTEKGTLYPGMKEAQVRNQIDSDLAELGPVNAVNNHMGSLGTANPELMSEVLSEIRKYNLVFVDSVTTSHTVASEIGRKTGVPVLRRDVFLDNERDVGYIKNQIRQLMLAAHRNGRAIAIGHPHPETFAAINEMVPEIKASGIELVPISRMAGR